MADDHRKPLARYGAMKSALREQLAPAQLHHQPGHDRILRLNFQDIAIYLRLDQGFGYWNPTSYTPFVFSAHPAEQARYLGREDFSIRSSATHATWIAVNEENRKTRMT